MSQKKALIAGATATGIVATGIVVALVTGITAGGSGSGTHYDTALDASRTTTPPTDWRRGYARTGSICYGQSVATSTCFAANVLAYTVDATDTGWPVEPAQVNRLPTNVSGACGGAPWVCATATMDSTTADPAGGTTASQITFGGGSADATAFGYTNSTALDLRLWAKCPAGVLDASNIGGFGHWTVDGTAMGAGWVLLETGHAAVTEAQAWTSNGSGGVVMRLSGNDCAIWHATATEESSYHDSTIPTTDATGESTGATAWTVDNSSGAYWFASGVTKVETGKVYSGTCWSYTAPTITLSGASTCKATRYALDLDWTW